jgi:glutamine amidotransferase
LDLGVNNLGSLLSAVNRLNDVEVRVVTEARYSSDPDLVILPGNGSFGEGMKALNSKGFKEYLVERHREQKYTLGICLGLQLFCESSEEFTDSEGLGIFSGHVQILTSEDTVPHTGWESVVWRKSHNEIKTDPTSNSYYFMHSYALRPSGSAQELAVSERSGVPFVSVVKNKNSLGVQFHPEKSSKTGSAFLKSVQDWVSGQV